MNAGSRMCNATTPGELQARQEEGVQFHRSSPDDAKLATHGTDFAVSIAESRCNRESLIVAPTRSGEVGVPTAA